MQGTVIVKLFTGILVVLLAWSLGRLIANVFEHPEEPAKFVVSMASSPSSESNMSTIDSPQHGAVYRLLGQMPVAETLKQSVSSEETVQNSQLAIKLLGLLSTERGGVAVIEQNNQSKLFFSGDTIQSGVVLEAIYPDYIVIRHRGMLEKVLMPTDDGLISSTMSSEANPARVAQITQAIKRSPMTMMQYARFQWVNQNGKPVGVQVWPKKEAAVFESLGFQAGDVVTRIDGVAMAEIMEQPMLWAGFMKKTRFQVEVERQGRPESFVVQLP